MAKILNDSFGAAFPHFCTDKREIWNEGAPRAKFHIYRGNVSPIFGPLSKNNIGMAVLRAGLPVITDKKRLALLIY